jgi:hypothetical protein
MTAASPCWFPVEPGTGIFFPGDLIRADGHDAEGVIEDITRDTAHVRTEAGDLIAVPVAAITAIADAATPPGDASHAAEVA